eukprot:361921-Chlamydomonas_euryale.AAC.1
MPDDVSDLNAGKSRQEVVSGEVQTGVASVADIDRSAELLIWVFQSLFGKKTQVGASQRCVSQLRCFSIACMEVRRRTPAIPGASTAWGGHVSLSACVQAAPCV